MAKRAVPQAPKSNPLSPEQMRAGIPTLKRRVAELRSLDVDALTEDTFGDALEALRLRIEDTLADIFGHGTVEYHRYMIGDLDETPFMMFSEPEPIKTRRPNIRRGVASAVTKLESAISIFEERLGDSGETATSKALRAYSGLDLHAEIARASSTLYQTGHYSEAIEAAVKALNALVRLRSDLEYDGSTLMERAFNPTNPVLRFNDLAGQSEKDEQKGFMMMFSGAVSGLRNPRAHGFIKDDPERALEFIAFVSLLAKLLDRATKSSTV